MFTFRNARLWPGLLLMTRFYFHRSMNGRRLSEDLRGRLFESSAEAWVHAFRRAPAFLKEAVRTKTENTYLSTEISDGTRILYIVRAKVTSEKQ